MQQFTYQEVQASLDALSGGAWLLSADASERAKQLGQYVYVLTHRDIPTVYMVERFALELAPRDVVASLERMAEQDKQRMQLNYITINLTTDVNREDR